ncbi:hypothetical protein [Elioraea thermophila]|uniref:hypothetical protein n=1 Tax=Elioraea thermophila TaxID=2185104 RepID=UPI000DF29433|nr:hypothetical protein [Elioraea thermophila]
MSGLAGSGPPPPRFAEAVEAIERALIALDAAGVGREAQAAALLAALLPRLVALHGPHAVAAVFGRLASAVAEQAGTPGRA